MYVLRAQAGASALTACAPSSPGTNTPFYQPLGTPTAVLGLPAIGPNGTQGGIATTFQFLAGVTGMEDPTSNGHSVSLPRAGLRGVAANGNETWTFFGSPVTKARTFNYENDSVLDIVGGSPAGYVFMMNGTTPTQPLYSTLIIPSNILQEAALSYLGVGVEPPTPSWGKTLSDAVQWAPTDPMYMVVPGVILFVTVLSFNLFGDGLRDALDPRASRG